MRGISLAAVVFLVGCHTIETVQDPVLRLEARDEFYTADALLTQLGQVAGAEVDAGSFPLASTRIMVPHTVRLSLSEFQALLLQYHIGMDVERDGARVERIALRFPAGEESGRLRPRPFINNDTVAVALYPLQRHQDIDIAFQSARTVQRQQTGENGDASGWSIPPLVMMQDLPENLPEQIEALSGRYETPPPPAGGGEMQTVYPFSLRTMSEFYGE